MTPRADWPFVSGVDDEARRIAEQLGLLPHPEGGFYRETFRSPLLLEGLPGGARAASTAIYFLLPAGSFSAFHRIRGAEEVWHHYAGGPLLLHLLADDGGLRTLRLGSSLADGELPQAAVPAGTLQAAEPAGPRWALCGCTTAPGFDFADLELPPRAELLARFPAQRRLIERLTR